MVKVSVPLTEETWIESGGDWVSVISSNVKAIRYEKDKLNLYIQFTSGRQYVYYRTTDFLAKQAFVASSAGQHVWAMRRRDLKKGIDYDQLR